MKGATCQDDDEDLQRTDSGLWLDSQEENRGSPPTTTKGEILPKMWMSLEGD